MSKNNSATARLRQDYLRLKKDPVPYVIAEPLPSNILEWHYVVLGPEDTPYDGGFYHGKLIFPREFPFKPPSIYMITPNGRFATNTRLCLSISDYHPDTWNPAWSVATILNGLLSFMNEDARTLGSIDSTTYEKRQFAYQSLAFNLKDRTFQELFPDLCKELKKQLESRNLAEQQQQSLTGNRDITTTGAAEFLRQQIANEQSPFYAAFANIAVVLGFIAFAYAVRCVLKSLG